MESDGIDLLSYCLEKANLIKFLNAQVNEREEKNKLLKEKDELSKKIDALVASHKKLEADVSHKRQIVLTIKKKLKLIRGQRQKSELTVCCNIENILCQYGIMAAEYHGGALNGVMSHRLMMRSKNVVCQIEEYLVTIYSILTNVAMMK